MSDNIILEFVSDVIYKGICKVFNIKKNDDISTAFPRLISFLEFEFVPKVSHETISICIGETFNRKKIYLDFKKNPHSYICGTTGSGKSVFLKSLLTNLIYFYDDIELYLCDLKMVELSIFRNVKQCKEFVYNVHDTDVVVMKLLEEVNFRYSLFMEKDVVDIYEYNNLSDVKKLKIQFLIIEEIGLLNKNSMSLLKKLISISRSCGCYVILTTQRPCNKIIDDVVKSNISNRITFRCEDIKNSIIAIDEPGAEKLKDNGNGLIKNGSKITEFQGYYIENNLVKKMIKDLKK